MRAGLVSVVIPMRNGERYIGDALRSVQRQTWTRWEAIVVDDGSSDGGAAVVRAFARDDRRVRLICPRRRRGVARARNLGIRCARGQYIALLDCDDLWREEKLARQLAVMEALGADFCCTACDLIDASGAPWKRRGLSAGRLTETLLLKENVVCTSSVLTKAALLKRRPFPAGFFHEDYALWLALASDGAAMYAVPDALTGYRVHGLGRSADKLRCARERWRVYREFAGLGFAQSAYYFLHYMLRGVRKYYG